MKTTSAFSLPPSTLILTDSPRVVDLKREFRELSERTEVLRAEQRLIEARKEAIGQEIFQLRVSADGNGRGHGHS